MHDSAELITRLFTAEMAARLVAADDPGRVLKDAITARFAALPALYRETAVAGQLSDEELRVARELCDYRMPLADGTSLPMGLPYNWYFGNGDGQYGEQAPLYIVQRIAFAGTLARAHRQTGEAIFAPVLRNYIVDYVTRYWLDGPALPPLDNWLCTAARAGLWSNGRFGGIFTALSDPALLDAFTFDDLLAVFRAIDHMMTGLIPNLALGSNWRVHELSGLFTQGYSYLFLAHAAHWRMLAANGLNEEFAIQIRDDGSHEELSVHYGLGTWLVFAAYHALAAQAPETGLHFDPAKMERGLAYFLSCCKPFGLQAAIGDDYASRSAAMLDGVSDPHRNEAPPAWDGMVREGAQWLAQAGESPTADFMLRGSPVPDWTSRHHRNSGLLLLRDGWQPERLYASLHMGYYANCHCHYGLLGLEVAGLGREFIVDPGCSALDDRPANANMARTRAHSTMCVDGLDQQVAAPVVPSRIALGAGYDFAVGVYKGGYTVDNPYGPGCTTAGRYDNAFSGTHFRHLLLVKGSYWVLFDALATRPGHTAETRLQFLPNMMTALPGGGYCTGWPSANLALLPLQWDGWTHGIHAGATEPIEGWMPGPRQTLLPAPVYKATCPTGHGPCWHGSLLFPYPGATPPAVRITPLPQTAGFGYRIETDAYTDYLFLSNSWMPAEIMLDNIRTDAPCLHLRLVDGQPTQGFTCEGSYLQIGDTAVFDAPGTMLAREFAFGAEVAVRVMQARWQG